MSQHKGKGKRPKVKSEKFSYLGLVRALVEAKRKVVRK